MGNKKAKIIAMLSGFFVIVLIMFRGAFQPGKMLFGNDTITIYMAFAEFAKKIVTVYHSLPAWLPDIYMGMPMIGSSSLLFFYPTDFLFMFLPVNPAYLYVPDLIIHMFLAALGMYLFLKKIKLGQPAALFGASAVMISGYIISYVYAGHWNNIKAGALIPLAFYFTQCALEDKKFLHYLNTALILALMMLATGMQILAYTFLAIIFYAGYYIIFVEKEKKQKIKSAVNMALCALFIMLFSAPQFIPSMQYTNYSWRGDVSYQNFISWSFHPAELITFLLPQFFGLFSSTYWGFMPFVLTTYYFGIIPFLLLFFVPWKGNHKKLIIFFGAAALVFTVFAFGGYTFIYGLFYFIPVFKQFRNPSRFLYLVTFFVITLSSIGLNSLTEGKEEKELFKSLKWLSIGAAAFAALLSLLLVSGGLDLVLASLFSGIRKTAMSAAAMAGISEMIKQDLISFIIVSAVSLAIIVIVIKKRLKSAFLAALLLAAVNFTDVYRIDSKFITFEDYSRFIQGKNTISEALLGDREPFRVANFDQLYGANRNIYYGIENLSGAHGLLPAAYKKMEESKSFNNININRQFNIKYYLSGSEIKVPGFVKVVDADAASLYRDTYARNRVFFSNNIVKVSAYGQVMLDYLNSRLFNGQQIITGPDFPKDSFLPGSGSVIIQEYSADRIKAAVESDSGGLAVHSAGYYPQWRAKVDGRDEKVYCVNYYSMAVMVPPGRHEVEFFYDKTGIYIGLLIAAVAFIFYGFMLYKYFKARK